MQIFRVQCGSLKTIVKLNKYSFDSYQAACTEAATLAIERLTRRTNIKNILGIYTVVKELSHAEDNPRFIALTYLVLRNASMPSLSKEFEIATEKYQKEL